MKIIVTGGRDYLITSHIYRVLNELQPDHVVHGDCKTGADAIATEWCRKNGVPYTAFPAHWSKQHRAAGPIRNGRMIHCSEADIVVAFPGGRGVNDCVKQAKKFGMKIMDLRAESEEEE
jgi:hypothetical protein